MKVLADSDISSSSEVRSKRTGIFNQNFRMVIYFLVCADLFTSLSAVAAPNIFPFPKFRVTNLNDSGAGSLRSAIIGANSSGGGLIRFYSATGAITLLSPLPSISGQTSVVGPGTNLLSVGGLTARLFIFESSATSVLAGLTIGRGGIQNAGSLVLSNCALIGSVAPSGTGGAIYTSGTLKIYGSTIVGNGAAGASGSFEPSGNRSGQPGYGGGIYVDGGSVGIFSSALQSNTVYGGSGSSYGSFECGNGAPGNGGAIFLSNGSLEIFNSTIFGNGAIGPSGYTITFPTGCTTGAADGFGGGVFIKNGTLLVASSTFSGNFAKGGNSDSRFGRGANAYGGAIYLNVGNARLVNSTIASNRVQGGAGGGGIVYAGDALGGGIYSASANVSLLSTIVAGNTNSDGVGQFKSEGYNLIGTSLFFTNAPIDNDQTNTNPKLGPLQDNGGRTFTHALLAGSPAIDAGKNSGFAIDQRGQPRTVDNVAISNVSGGDGTDVGALEVDHNLRMTETRPSGSNFLVRFTSVSDKTYGIQYKQELTNELWTYLPDVIPGTGGIATGTNVGASDLPWRFYRAFEQAR